ncbi:uncharacterized protein VNE69_05043 [Vairimorpha necatrix]|uniref:Uncharacterized protein n=1 Tax=Vairimorpha necatrix TaxID=6039 RepID=A0AAX4JC70_9MICR
MYILFYITFNFSYAIKNDQIKLEEGEVGSKNYNSDNYFKTTFDVLPQNEYQNINLDHYNTVVRDFFGSIKEHPEIKKKIEKLLSKNNNINRNLLLGSFKHYLHEFYLGKSFDFTCSYALSFLESLAFNSFRPILRLASIANFNEYINNRDIISYQILKSVELEINDECENEITQLFNIEKFNRIYLMLNVSNIDEEYLRDKRYAPLRKSTTGKPFVKDDVKKVYIGPPPRMVCDKIRCIDMNKSLK